MTPSSSPPTKTGYNEGEEGEGEVEGEGEGGNGVDKNVGGGTRANGGGVGALWDTTAAATGTPRYVGGLGFLLGLPISPSSFTLLDDLLDDLHSGGQSLGRVV